MPLLSKIMLSLQEDPGTMWKFYKEHLDEVGERIKLHKLRSTVLPLQDAGAPVAATQWIHQREFVRTTAEVRRAPACLCRARDAPLGLPPVERDAAAESLRVESTRSLPLPRSRRCAHIFAPTASRAAHAELSPPIARFLAECCRASDRHARLHPEAVVRVRARCRHAVVYTLYCCCRSIRPTTMRVGGPRFVRARSGAMTAAYWPHPSCTERYSSAGLGSVCVRISRVPEQMRNLLEIT